ncbi:MAG TPA: M3 family metallopeptidase [Prolixibacteraceae bacterium]|nr:M3 family metallopeptidase [Prolixibacteraceae bacterium]
MKPYRILLVLLATTIIKTHANMNSESNPLLGTYTTPHETVPFDRIKPEHFMPAFKVLFQEAKKDFNALLAEKEAPTFENTILPVEERYDEISRIGLILFNLNSAETNPKLQAVTQKVSPRLTRFVGKIMLNHRYFNRVKAVYENRHRSGLTPEEIRLVETMYTNMKRNGAGFGWYKKLRLIAIQMKLSKLTLRFNDRVLAETNAFELHLTNEDDVKGIPETAREEAAMTAKNKNKEGWIFTLNYPSFQPFMTYAENRELREKMYRAYTSRGNHRNKNDNNKLIRKIVNLRLKLSNLLGYSSYAAYVLEERMAQTPDNVHSFLNKLHEASRPFALAERDELNEFARESDSILDLKPWDFSFYSEKLKKQKFGFDEEMVKPYFRLDHVIGGIFGLAETLYGITFTEVRDIPVYHPDVKTFEAYEPNGQFLAVLYADFHPRESKQGGAWMTEYRTQSNMGGNMKRPHISICGNFSKPTENKPALLTFDEVSTFLHEFGHALHGMLANTVYPSLAGTNVYRDFVELPSQIMENWAVETEWLQTFAVHYETGEKMPAELVQKLIDARNFQAGYQSERQLSFGMADMAWHSLEKPFTGNVVRFEQEANMKTQLFEPVEGSSLSTSFSHIFGGGYAAGYYGYKWAEVLDADAFSLFKERGIFDRETASLFRTTILEKGGTADPMELYVHFRGHEPTIDALLERSGLKKK